MNFSDMNCNLWTTENGISCGGNQHPFIFEFKRRAKAIEVVKTFTPCVGDGKYNKKMVKSGPLI